MGETPLPLSLPTASASPEQSTNCRALCSPCLPLHSCFPAVESVTHLQAEPKRNSELE